MTFNEFVTAAELACPHQDTSLFVSVSHRRYSEGYGKVLEFRIWDGRRQAQYAANTPEETLALYRTAVSPAPPVSETMETLGTPSLPE